ncbi:MAG: DUF2142 domain-containing protein [Acetatifactor sp.]|nr:DUF2142 domain-containing protein [Acetatifactor sp.]
MKLPKSISVFITCFYITLYLIVALTLVFTQPFGDPPDEFNRFLIPQYIAEHGTLPNGYEESIRINGYGFSYAFQPILPYMAQGYAMRVVRLFSDSESAMVLTGRLVDCLFGLLTAIVIVKLSKLWFKDDRFAWIFAFMTTFLPQSIFIHTYINTDSCCMLSIAVMLLALTAGLQNGFERNTNILLSVGIILCALSYYNAYGYILSCILLFTASFLRKEKKLRFDWKPFLKKGLFISCLVLAGIAWWFIRSAILYDGDFLGLRVRQECAMLYAEPAYHPLTRETWQNLGYSPLDMLGKSDFINLSILSFIAMYSHMAIPAPIWLYRFYKYFLLLSLLLCATVSTKKLVQREGEDVIRSKPLRIFYYCNLIGCILIPILLSIVYSYTTDYQPQGRYLLPSLIPLIFYSIHGIEKTWKSSICNKFRNDKLLNVLTVLLITVIVGLLLWMIFGVVLPYYGYLR